MNRMEPPSLQRLVRSRLSSPVCLRPEWIEPLSRPQCAAALRDSPAPEMELHNALTVDIVPKPNMSANEKANELEPPPDSAVHVVDSDSELRDTRFPLGMLTMSAQITISFTHDSDHAHVEVSESSAQFALRQPAILTVLMQFLPVATGTLKSASLVSMAWYGAAIHNINQVGRSMPIDPLVVNHKDRRQERWTRTAIDGVRRYLCPQLVDSLLMNRPAMAAILARKRLPAFLRVFHFVDSWNHSEAKLRTLLFVLGSQAQPASCLQSGIPLVLDSFLASSPRSAHMGFVWSTMESTLERDAQAVLADLASRVARHSGALPASGYEEPAGLREMRLETEVMECGTVSGNHAPRHKLAVINRRLVLNVNAWCVKWISMMQHPRTITKAEKGKKPTVLSSEAIDLALYRILGTLDREKRAAWDTLLHQILKCTNKWLGIIRAMVRIMDSLMEHEQLFQGLPEFAPPGALEDADAPPVTQAETMDNEGSDSEPSESSANVD